MGAENGEKSASVRLTTWKEIATFLGRDERTVKRWEESRGLPVRRVPGSGRASVFAYAHELQAWLDGAHDPMPVPEVVPSKIPRLWPVSALAAAVLVTAGVLVWDRSPVPPTQTSRDPAAVALYRSGLHEWQTRTPTGLTRAVKDLNAAIARDPNYAQAYEGLADTYNLMREYTLMPPQEAYAKAFAAATRAVAIDPSLAGAHAALAFVDFYGRRRVADARREFERAVELDPKSATAHHWYATFLMTVGDFASAESEIGKAAELDSESSAILADKGLILYYAGKPDAAVRLLTQLEADQPGFASPPFYLAFIGLVRGDDRGYLRELKQHAEITRDAGEGALVSAGTIGLMQNGRAGMLTREIAVRLASVPSSKNSAYGIAQNYALLGDRAHALSYLSASVARQEPETIAIKIDPELHALRTDPAFTRLLGAAGF